MSKNNRPFSPCLGCCTTVLGDSKCQNCKRTSDEVDNWNFMTDEEREEIWERLEENKDVEY